MNECAMFVRLLSKIYLHFSARWCFPDTFASYKIGIHDVLGFWLDNLNPFESRNEKT